VEELDTLVARLESEHAAVSKQLREREAEQQRRLAEADARLQEAQRRCERAQQALANAELESTALIERRDHVERSVMQLRGRMWMIRHSSTLMVFACVGVFAWPVFAIWNMPFARLLQLGVLGLALLVIPRRT
jgi:hypothetical protein